MGQKIAGDSTPPVYLGPKQLADLDNLRVIDKGRRAARVYMAGDIEPMLINAIAEKLALADVQDAKLYKGIPDQQPEDWRDYLTRLRGQAERGESLVGEINRAKGNRAPADELAPRVESRAGGLYWVTPKIDRQSGEVIRPGEWICDQMGTVGIGNDGSEAYLIIEMVPEGTEKIIHEAMPRNEIGMPAGWSRLRGRGVAITTSAHLLNKLAEYLQRQGSEPCGKLHPQQDGTAGLMLCLMARLLGSRSDLLHFAVVRRQSGAMSCAAQQQSGGITWLP
jgi:putative DNA primase/helicase